MMIYRVSNKVMNSNESWDRKQMFRPHGPPRSIEFQYGATCRAAVILVLRPRQISSEEKFGTVETHEAGRVPLGRSDEGLVMCTIKNDHR
jgi:hypothetical protein